MHLNIMNENNSQNSLRTMQEMLTDMLKHFHDFCSLYSLRYYVFGGTALGAARHKGFIPWDDDLDVCMPRPDYEKLMKIYSIKNQNKRYVLETLNSSKEYYYSFSKIYDTETTLIEFVRNPLKRGIYIDIFPLDGVSDNSLFAKCRCCFINLILQVKMILAIVPDKKRSVIKNSFVYFTHMIGLIFCFKERSFAILIDKLAQHNDYEKASLVGNLVSGWGYKGVMDKKVYGKGKKAQFETIKIICPEKNEIHLTKLYGDWKTPPPETKRTTHHSYYLDLTKSYLEQSQKN